METSQRTQENPKNPTNHQERLEYEKKSIITDDSPLFRQPKRISDDSRDAEMCDKNSDSGDEEDELNVDVDVENDDTLCPVDLTRRHEKFTSFENLIPTPKTEDSDFKGLKVLKDDDKLNVNSVKRSESVCSDVSRSESPRDPSPSVVPHQNRRLAFSVENILDPNKFTGKQSVYSDGVCCWKPHQENIGSSEYEGSEQG
ncbi:hypothetical protein ILUMI_03540 [Ignelater luminosus]|uniref:Uncharacterized protein n=1 Tax=Ignelater luminosus TaxID=2038154 RepID=A0A8K0DGD8_IGNLU|nr:hypothetical protein ILUMI_03540 [Ignelater luminosus]